MLAKQFYIVFYRSDAGDAEFAYEEIRNILARGIRVVLVLCGCFLRHFSFLIRHSIPAIVYQRR